MIFWFAENQRKKPTWVMLEDAIWRNFDGLTEIDAMKIFQENLYPIVRHDIKTLEDTDSRQRNFIKSCMNDKNNKSRHFLLLTENFGAVSILQQHEKFNDAVVIYGSSFPCDQKYTQVCRDINRIKVSMERGDLVILLNLEVLYESLYDVLNQYYVHLGGEQYVDIGLGTHRMKCKVHENFRIIVVAEKTRVYEKYPVPLINRLEKHFLTTSSLLSPMRQKLVERLEMWVHEFVEQANFPESFGVTRPQRFNLKEGNVFIGYHQDTCASIITFLCRKHLIWNDELLKQDENQILDESKSLLLWCATPDAVLRCRMDRLDIHNPSYYQDVYFVQQKHESLLQCVAYLKDDHKDKTCLQVTTHSKLLTEGNLKELSHCVGVSVEDTALVSLQSFDTEQQFCFKVQNWFDTNGDFLLIVQCEYGPESENIIACARHCIIDLRKDCKKDNAMNYVVLIIHIPRKMGNSFTGFQCGDWRSIHIDEISSHETDFPRIPDIIGKTIADIVEYGTPATTNSNQELIYEREKSTPHSELKVDTIPNDIKHSRTADQRSFNVESMVKDSVQPAVTMIIESDRNSRASERVKILLKWLNHNYKEGVESVLIGICNHLKLLIKEKEQTVSVDERLRWLYNEATSWKYISRAGTFRKALKQCIQDKLSPIFAGIIASIDYNRNMNILENHTPSSWQHRLWLKILSDPHCTGFTYQVFRHDLQRNEKPRFIVKSYGCSGFPFEVKMPHMWLLYELVSNTRKAEKTFSSSVNILDILEKKHLGQVLKKIGYSQEILESYLSDFIYIVYPVSSYEEHKILFDCLYAAVNGKQALKDGEKNENILRSVLDVHIVFENKETQFKRFKQLVQIWPHCCKAICSVEESMKDQYDLDSLGLKLLLKTIEPNVEIFTDVSGKRKEWIRKIQKYRGIVEQILESQSSERRKTDLESLKQKWIRLTVVKLFIDHVCLKKEQYFRRCMSLLTMLENNADIKSRVTLETIEKFLKICMKEAVRNTYGEQHICKACKTEILGRPLKMPCKCIICVSCHREISMVQSMEKKCPACHSVLLKDFKPTSVHGININDEQLEDFRKCCNGFFMAFVSQICFSDDNPPADNVIEKLMSYITVNISKEEKEGVTSKKMALFTDGRDYSPVVRTYLLKQLLRTNPDDVKGYLKAYINSSKAMFEDDSSIFLEICAIVIYCVEDTCLQKSLQEKETDELEKALSVFEKIKKHADSKRDLLDQLFYLAEARFCLHVTSKFLFKVFVEKSSKKSAEIFRLFKNADIFCETFQADQPCVFMIKNLCFNYGLANFQMICQADDNNVLTMKKRNPLTNEVQECVDRFIVCGDAYMHMREALTQSILEKTTKPLQDKVKELNCEESEKQIIFLLAIFREITLSHLYPMGKRRFTFEAKETFKASLKDLYFLKKEQQQFSITAMDNKIFMMLPSLNVTEGMSLKTQDIICAIYHFYLIIRDKKCLNPLLKPLQHLVLSPTKMKDSFLPTMPQDDTSATIDVHIAPERNINIPDNLKVRTEISKRSKLFANKEEYRKEWRESGHILGTASDRNAVAKSLRDLSPTETSILRFFTHVSMLLGAFSDSQVVVKMISPEIDRKTLFQFLWKHIEKDVAILQTALSKNADDVWLILHLVCHSFCSSEPKSMPGKIMEFLTTTRERNIWEFEFSQLMLKPVLKSLDMELVKLNEALSNDRRQGNDPMTCLLVQTEFDSDSSVENLHKNPLVWRYRKPLTVDNFVNTVLNKSPLEVGHILHLLMKEQHTLRAIRMVPSILKLQRNLIRKFQGKIDRTHSSTSVEKLLKDNQETEEWKTEQTNLVIDFVDAWTNVKEELSTSAFSVPGGYARLAPWICQSSLTEDSPISVFLPTFQGDGLCSYGLLYHLLQKHNEIVEKVNLSMNGAFMDMPKVLLKDLSTAHLIMLHPERDILPTALANCQYAFQTGTGIQMDYDYSEIERSLQERFLASKSVIKLDSFTEYEIMTYKSEASNASICKELRIKVKQEPLSQEMRHELYDEFEGNPELCDAIGKIELAVNFIKSIGADPEMSFEEYMRENLQIEPFLRNQKIRKNVRCKHVQALWVAVMMLYSEGQASYGEDVLKEMRDSLKARIADRQKNLILILCQKFSKENLIAFNYFLFECIMLQIAMPLDEGVQSDNSNCITSVLQMRELR